MMARTFQSVSCTEGSKEGSTDASFLHDGTTRLRGRLHSSIDPVLTAFVLDCPGETRSTLLLIAGNVCSQREQANAVRPTKIPSHEQSR